MNTHRRTAFRLWGNGWGEALGLSFEEYLATIPPIPERPASCPEEFNRLMLWDTRPLKIKNGAISIGHFAKLIGVDCGFRDDHFVSSHPTHVCEEQVCWVRCQSTRCCNAHLGGYEGVSPDWEPPEFPKGEVAIDLVGGLFLCAEGKLGLHEGESVLFLNTEADLELFPDKTWATLDYPLLEDEVVNWTVQVCICDVEMIEAPFVRIATKWIGK